MHVHGSEFLDRDTALYARYTSKDFKNDFLIPHLRKKKRYHKIILRTATFEVYLQSLERFQHNIARAWCPEQGNDADYARKC